MARDDCAVIVGLIRIDQLLEGGEEPGLASGTGAEIPQKLVVVVKHVVLEVKPVILITIRQYRQFSTLPLSFLLSYISTEH